MKIAFYIACLVVFVSVVIEAVFCIREWCAHKKKSGAVKLKFSSFKKLYRATPDNWEFFKSRQSYSDLTFIIVRWEKRHEVPNGYYYDTYDIVFPSFFDYLKLRAFYRHRERERRAERDRIQKQDDLDTALHFCDVVRSEIEENTKKNMSDCREKMNRIQQDACSQTVQR